MIILVPLLFTSSGILAAASRQTTTERLSQEWLEGSDLTVARVQIDGEDVELSLTGQGDVPAVDELKAQLDAELEIDSHVTVEYFPSTVIESSEP